MWSEFSMVCLDYICADMARPHLKSKADTENRDAEIENFVIEWRGFSHNRSRAAGDDDASGLYKLYVVCANP